MAGDTDDAEQVALIRAHLVDRIVMAYDDVERGAEIRYASEDASLVEAIHQWFDAQLRDHGEQHAQAHHAPLGARPA